MKKVLQWLNDKYGIKAITISAYNLQVNGKIECGHFDMHQALAKACDEDVSKWYYFLKHVLWADRVTPR